VILLTPICYFTFAIKTFHHFIIYYQIRNSQKQIRPICFPIHVFSKQIWVNLTTNSTKREIPYKKRKLILLLYISKLFVFIRSKTSLFLWHTYFNYFCMICLFIYLFNVFSIKNISLLFICICMVVLSYYHWLIIDILFIIITAYQQWYLYFRKDLSISDAKFIMNHQHFNYYK
jgi:hypothetical protein